MTVLLPTTASSGVDLVRLDRFHKKSATTTASIKTNRPMPIPIPAFAPVERPPDLFELAMESVGAGDVDVEFIGAGDVVEVGSWK